jgi:hypothetical protein
VAARVAISIARRVGSPPCASRLASPAAPPPERYANRSAATKFLKENQHKKSIGDDAVHLRGFDPFIGALALKQVHKGSLQSFIGKRKADGVKTSTINGALAVTRHILNLAASEWMDQEGITWLEHAPKIKLMPVKNARPAYPLSREEQGDVLSRATRSSRKNGFVQDEHGLSRGGGPRAA